MRISIELLRSYVDLPTNERDVRDLFDDLGLEVKRYEADGGGHATLELLANRGDHHCYAGIAREISGRTGAAVHTPEVAALEIGFSPVRLTNSTPLCLVYTATLLDRGSGARDLPMAATRAVWAAGQEPVSAPVDATNLANLELGQPTHAFDADRIAGGITIRTSRAGERAWPLFRPESVALPEGTLVIADDEKVLAIAGVIGCEESKTTESTRRLLLESATFDPVAVRKASRALGIHTDSSARFERGGDPTAPLAGAGRVVVLLESVGWKRNGTTGVVGDWKDPKRTIALDVAWLRTFLGLDLSIDDARARLIRLGFAVSPPWPGYGGGHPEWPLPDGIEVEGGHLAETVLVRVPPHRLWDVEFDADVAEEVAKSVGYNEGPLALPPIDMGSVPSPEERARARIDEHLVSHGFFEVITDGFYSRELFERLGVPDGHPLRAHVETTNALERGYSLLKNNCVLQAVDAVATNLRVGTREIRAFEWTRTFHPAPDAENGVCTEHRALWLAACGPVRSPTWAEKAPPPADVAWASGLVEEIGVLLGLPFTLGPTDPAMPLAAVLHPHRQRFVLCKGRVVGVIGEVAPRVCAAFKIKRERPIYVELSASGLFAPGTPTAYVPPPETQPVRRDLAFTLGGRVTAGEVIDVLRAAGPANLSDVRVTDRFDHVVADAPVRTFTFALAFSQDERALTADEVEGSVEGMVRAVADRLGPRGVTRRT